MSLFAKILEVKSYQPEQEGETQVKPQTVTLEETQYSGEPFNALGQLRFNCTNFVFFIIKMHKISFNESLQQSGIFHNIVKLLE